MKYEPLVFTATVDPASTNAEATTNLDVTVTGVKLGDVVVCQPGAAVPDNLIFVPRVSAANTVRINFINNNVAAGAAINMASSTWTFVVVNRPGA